uniref:Uncharacterized protein n=1 Tax=Glossina palpalis gambiensis TaxID=67801 RepID=A0A1B0BBE7_9MUSC
MAEGSAFGLLAKYQSDPVRGDMTDSKGSASTSHLIGMDCILTAPTDVCSVPGLQRGESGMYTASTYRRLILELRVSPSVFIAPQAYAPALSRSNCVKCNISKDICTYMLHVLRVCPRLCFRKTKDLTSDMSAQHYYFQMLPLRSQVIFAAGYDPHDSQRNGVGCPASSLIYYSICTHISEISQKCVKFASGPHVFGANIVNYSDKDILKTAIGMAQMAL